MVIGVIGLGVVGSALSFAFRKVGHKVIEHDPIKLNTTLDIVKDTTVVYICVPTPPKENGECDTSIVESIIQELTDLKYTGVICIKSTVVPGTTQKLIDKYTNGNICYSSEHLRERSAITDCVENHQLLAIGTLSRYVEDVVKASFGRLPKNYAVMEPTQCELLKYMSNVFGALRVVFALEMSDLCKKLGQDYIDVKDAFITLNKLPDIYFDVNESCLGYSSVCWNKDVPALVNLGKQLGLDLPIIYNIEKSNSKHKRTPFSGTREHY